VRRAGAIETHQRGLQRRLGDEALLDQRLVVVELFLRDLQLRTGSVGLLLRLAPARLVFGGVNAGEHLTGPDRIAFAHRQVHQFTGHTGLDQGDFRGLERARDGQAQGQGLHARRQHIAGGQLQHHGRGRRCLRDGGLRRTGAGQAPADHRQARDGQARDDPEAAFFHGSVRQKGRAPAARHGGG